MENKNQLAIQSDKEILLEIGNNFRAYISDFNFKKVRSAHANCIMYFGIKSLIEAASYFIEQSQKL